MTDNRTTGLLREGLAERGIEWRSGLEGVTFVGDWCFVEYDDGKLAATCEPVLTPEQAIAATLGTHEIIHCEDCENAHFFYPWRYPGERSTVEVGTCALMAEGVTIERDGYCAFAERREQ